MKIKLKTRVQSPFIQVLEGFDNALLNKLNPPFPPVKLLKYEGNEPGNRVELELNFILFKQRWISEITYFNHDKEHYEFVDEGIKLPFFLNSWKHRHKLVNIGGEGTDIIDDINFTAPVGLTLIIFPLIWLQFVYRKPIYKNYFKKFNENTES